MKIMLLSNNVNANRLFQWLKSNKHDVILYDEPVTMEMIEKIIPDLVISYNYRYIIKEDVINYMGNMIINMHISLLPWNKGASPNIWSFIDDTPKGVTIHLLEKGLDTGKIIFQKELFFDEETETLNSTYDILNREITDLLIYNWDVISSGNCDLKNQIGEGSYHRTSDLNNLLKGRQIDYSMTIKEFKKFINDIHLS